MNSQFQCQIFAYMKEWSLYPVYNTVMKTKNIVQCRKKKSLEWINYCKLFVQVFNTNIYSYSVFVVFTNRRLVHLLSKACISGTYIKKLSDRLYRPGRSWRRGFYAIITRDKRERKRGKRKKERKKELIIKENKK